MRTAFGTAVDHLAATLGGAPAGWTWGRLHTRHFPSLTAAAGLGYGPRAASGDAWTVDAAEGGLHSAIGPSWRMIVGFGVRGGPGGPGGPGGMSGPGGPGGMSAEGVYPGGQSENPASPWYADLIADWWNGRYLPMPAVGRVGGGAVRWSLRPVATAAAVQEALRG
jgi:penicillin amidase